MTDPTPSTPQTLSGRALDIAVAKLLGYAVGKNDGSDWYYLIRPDGSENYCHVSKIESKVWNDVPRFTRSLDACAPLIEEMYVHASVDMFGLDWSIIMDSRAALTVFMKRLPNNRPCFTESSDATNFIEASATALCLAYCKFKELTTEVSTANAKTNAI